MKSFKINLKNKKIGKKMFGFIEKWIIFLAQIVVQDKYILTIKRFLIENISFKIKINLCTKIKLDILFVYGSIVMRYKYSYAMFK